MTLDPHLDIRRASASDLQELVRLRLQFIAESSGAETACPGELKSATEAFFSRLFTTNAAPLCRVAVTRASAVGLALIIPFDRPPKPRVMNGQEGYLCSVYTEPPYRRMGISSSLVRGVISDARQAGLSRLWLYAERDVEPLYRRFGFKPVHREQSELELDLREGE